MTQQCIPPALEVNDTALYHMSNSDLNLRLAEIAINTRDNMGSHERERKTIMRILSMRGLR